MTRTAKISLRALAGVVLAASSEETRYYLNGVCLEISARQTIYVATDGHKMLVHRIVLGDDEPDNTLLGTWILPAAQCKLMKLKPRDTDDAELSAEDGATRHLKISLDGASFSFDTIDGTFPSWRRVLPGKGAVVVSEAVRFNWAYVADLCKAVAVIRNDKTAPNATLKQTVLSGPAWLDFGTQDTVAVVMPMRLTGVKDSDPRPAWLDDDEPTAQLAETAE